MVRDPVTDEHYGVAGQPPPAAGGQVGELDGLDLRPAQYGPDASPRYFPGETGEGGAAAAGRPCVGELVAPIRALSRGVDGQGIRVVGQDCPAGPDPLALVTLQLAAAQPIAALEAAEAPLAAGAVVRQPPASAPGTGLGTPSDERARRRQPGKGLLGLARHEPAIHSAGNDPPPAHSGCAAEQPAGGPPAPCSASLPSEG
jgi:hypothetical protein